MPAKPKFTREQLQIAALQIVDEEGLSGLSMRTLAAALGTGPMTIYNYFRDRGELDTLLVEAVLSEVHIPEEEEDWREDVRAILQGMWQAIRSHPNVIPLVLMRRTLQETTLEIAESLLRALARSSCSPEVLLTAFRTLNGFLVGLAQAQLSAPLRTSDGGSNSRVSSIKSMPDDSFPRLRQIARVLAKTHSDEEFHRGVEFILDGMVQRVAIQTEHKPPRRKTPKPSTAKR
jgi:AcrR family transcriptional regulator